MNAAAHRWLLNAKPDRAYVIPDKDTERYLVDNGYVAYVPAAKPFMTMTKKGVAYAQREKAWIRSGRTSHA